MRHLAVAKAEAEVTPHGPDHVTKDTDKDQKYIKYVTTGVRATKKN